MFCLEAESFDSDDPAVDGNSLSCAMNGVVTDCMTDPHSCEQSVTTPESAVYASSRKVSLSRAEDHRQRHEPLSWRSLEERHRFQIPQDSPGSTGKHTMTLGPQNPFLSLENLRHKVVAAEIHRFPLTSEMKRDHLLNQQTTSTMAIETSTMAHSPHNHVPGIHQQGVTSFAQQTIPSKRSRSIKIKRGRGSDDFTSSSISASSEQMYDWATWRMYHRITSARRNRSAIMPVTDVPDPSLNSRAYRGFPGFQEATGDYTVHDGLATTDEGSDEGVFVMDL